MRREDLSRIQAREFYRSVLADKDVSAMRELCQTDLFFLMYIACKRVDMDHDWIFARCRELERAPNGYLDLWSREHFKSSLITFGKTIQDILCDPNVTCGIFSHTRPIAKGFLAQIKREFEDNEFLKSLFPEVLYENPQKEAPLWSIDNGIIVKRTANPKEATVEAWGLVDGQPTGKHFSHLIYDDVVTLSSVTTPDQILKTTDAFSMSLNLGKEGGVRRGIGTRYHLADTYKEIIKRETLTPRVYPATDDGTVNGNPVLWTKAIFLRKFQDMGSYVASCQLLQNPIADNAMGFKDDWLMWYNEIHGNPNMNVYILVDPASKKKSTSDYTTMGVIGLCDDGNYYLLDGIRDRMNLTERTNALFKLVREWEPITVGYEEYGLQADIEHIQYVQEKEGYRFYIKPVGGSQSKFNRIQRLIPAFEQHRFYLPRSIRYVGYDGMAKDFIQQFLVDEYRAFPVCQHDDMLDMIARIFDIDAVFPKKQTEVPRNVYHKEKEYHPLD